MHAFTFSKKANVGQCSKSQLFDEFLKLSMKISATDSSAVNFKDLYFSRKLTPLQTFTKGIRGIFRTLFFREKHLKVAPKVMEAALQRCSYKKVFSKYAANLQENTHPEVCF